ncbi:MAG: metallopeptidase TldD-related protein, partial [Thermoplasmata archaeon]|nr:metallopeptidase TldD-related protein [Thermoplasmata archaeon]
LAYLGFNSRAEEQGWSCLRTRRGRTVAPPTLSVTDDGTDARSIPRGFDYEGTAKRRVPLIDHGVAGPAVADLRSAARHGSAPSGHAPLPESPWG